MAPQVTFKGKPVNLNNEPIKVGDKAPDFKAVSKAMEDVHLNDYRDQIKIITTFPSIDTPVCDLQVKTFNEKASLLSKDIKIIGVSMDLPFAQARFCDTYKIGNVDLLSDYKYHDFADKYGLLISEIGLLARSVFILDKANTVKYVQIVKEVGDQPDYDLVIEQLTTIIVP